MSKVVTSRFFVGNDLESISRAVESLQQFRLEKDAVRVSAAYTVQPEDDVILCDSSGGAFTVTLPPIDDAQRKSYYIKKINSGAGTITIQGSGSEQVDGAASINIAGTGRDSEELIPERNTNTSTNAWWTV